MTIAYILYIEPYLNIMYQIAIQSFLVSLLLTPVVRFLAMRLDIYDHPSSSVKTHTQPVPYLGGTAIFIAIFIGLLSIDRIDIKNRLEIVSFAVTLVTLFSLGTLDDIYHFSARLRFSIQFIVFYFFINSTGHLFQVTESHTFNIVFTLFWLVGITNAFNIIDIMDGLSSGVAIIISIFMAILSYLTSNPLVLLISLSIFGASLGFIGFNFSRKLKIFMGDGGSTLLGAILGINAVLFCQTDPLRYLDLLSIFILFGIPIYDTILVMILRIKKGISPFIGSKDHFALRMVALGFSRLSTVVAAYLVTMALGFVAIVVHSTDFKMAILITLAMVLLGIVWGRMLAIVDISDKGIKS